ncbi:hypothetical protein EJB05_50341 [Eragrostis curvula]|uniref:Uncharacterized protein n=1 Tax=Eragrostis curvula TaxID=38414 RepID=A0A5J9SZX4_9POAL|nr:hypothetical protein EJB05_50341 [Eragrostis curvula]
MQFSQPMQVPVDTADVEDPPPPPSPPTAGSDLGSSAVLPGSLMDLSTFLMTPSLSGVHPAFHGFCNFGAQLVILVQVNTTHVEDPLLPTAAAVWRFPLLCYRAPPPIHPNSIDAHHLRIGSPAAISWILQLPNPLGATSFSAWRRTPFPHFTLGPSPVLATEQASGNMCYFKDLLR